MNSRLIQLADAVVRQLNLGGLPGGFTAERRFLPYWQLADGDTALHVTVVPGGMSAMADIARDAVRSEYVIDIGVQKKLDSPESAEIPQLLALTEKIADFFQSQGNGPVDWADQTACKNTPAYLFEHLKQFIQFTSVISLTYTAILGVEA